MKTPWILACLALFGCSGAPAATGAFPAEPLLTVESVGSTLSIEVRTAPSQPPTRGMITAQFTVKDASGKLRDGLSIAVSTWMPAMGHGASVVPTVAASGNGTYVVSDVDVYMAGAWELRAAFDGPLKDSATIPLQIP